MTTIVRAGRTFEVVDDPATRAWRFWEDEFATGRWEAATLAAIAANLTPGATYVDIGAWVGPTVLWAAPLCSRVIAAEPDPVAFDVLQVNVAANADNVDLHQVAVAASAGRRTLASQGEWGDSMSSLVARPGHPSTEVDAVTFDHLVDGVDGIGLVKIDIEGGEGELFPVIAPRLRALGCPMILALHLPWVVDPAGLLDAVAGFAVSELAPHPQFPTLLLEPT